MHSSTPTAPDEGHNPPMAPKTIAVGGEGNDAVLDVLRPEFQEVNGPLTHSRVTEFGVFFAITQPWSRLKRPSRAIWKTGTVLSPWPHGELDAQPGDKSECPPPLP